VVLQVAEVRKQLGSFRTVPASPASEEVRKSMNESKRPPPSPQLQVSASGKRDSKETVRVAFVF
jgi:hypothetical protein